MESLEKISEWVGSKDTEEYMNSLGFKKLNQDLFPWVVFEKPVAFPEEYTQLWMNECNSRVLIYEGHVDDGLRKGQFDLRIKDLETFKIVFECSAPIIRYRASLSN